MNLSRLFILRPVATTLLMLAILLAGLLAYRLLPVSALPEVDYPTIQVTTLYPGASPDVMTSSVTAPLERQFGQMPGLTQMSSTSSGGASVITLRSARPDAGRGRAGGAGGHQRRQQPAAQRPAHAAGLQQGQPGRRAGADAGHHLAHAAADRVHDLVEPRGAEDLAGAGVGLVSIAGGRARPCASRPTRRRWPRGLTLEDVRTAIAAANVNQAKGSFDGPQRASTIDANDQLKSAREYAT
jgi:multidrug efflux pump